MATTLSQEDIAVISTGSKQSASVQILLGLLAVGGVTAALRSQLHFQPRIGATYQSLYMWGSGSVWVALLCWFVWRVYTHNTRPALLVQALAKGVAITFVKVTKGAGGRKESQVVRVTLGSGKDLYLKATSTVEADRLLEVLHRHAPQAAFA